MGKEFDGVLLVEGQHKARFFDDRSESAPCMAVRRVLRVGFRWQSYRMVGARVRLMCESTCPGCAASVVRCIRLWKEFSAMRPSNKGKFLEAAVRVAERDGVTSVTLDSVAAEAKVTKGGLMYHFRSKDALLVGIQEFLAASWDEAMAEAAGKPAEDATAEEKVAAYARVATQSATSADLAFILEFAKHPAASAPWTEVAAKWTPSPEQAAEDERLFELFIARLAADGLWTFESLVQTPLDEDLRRRIAERIAAMISVPEQ